MDKRQHIIAKLLAPKGEYDIKLEEEESILASWVAQKMAQRALIVTTDNKINQKIYEDLKGEEELYGYKKKRAEELLRLQADTFHDIQVKGLK